MKNIIFDIGGVLLKDKPISILNKFMINQEDYQQIVSFFKNWEKLDLGYQTIKEKLLECKLPSNIYNKYENILLKYYEYRDINKDIIKLIKSLKEKNYHIYILSDNNKEAANYYIKHYLQDIDGYIFSCDYNITKINGLFDIFLDKFKLNPCECYFIDNNKENIQIARKYNIMGYLFNENDDINKLYCDMKNNNIDI
ncbi:MAG: HAD hydrolase-like protein [Bacilli bacterium]|nr:HAD hydrolase-like protein [Bacilli bacterium]